jgi:hypothetical protein
MITDTIFNVMVTYIFLKPLLTVLKAAGGNVSTAACRRLERTKRWNLAGVFVTVGSSTVLYINCIAYFALCFTRQFSLSRSAFGSPFVFGLPVDSVLSTLGMILLCGMFKDVAHPLYSRFTFKSKFSIQVAGAPEEQKQDFAFAFDSRAYSEQPAAPEETPVQRVDGTQPDRFVKNFVNINVKASAPGSSTIATHTQSTTTMPEELRAPQKHLIAGKNLLRTS